jgi:aminoglycoside phosphotransferase family enzyme
MARDNLKMPGTPQMSKRVPRPVRALYFATAVLFSRRAKAGWVLYCHGHLAAIRRYTDIWNQLNRFK